MTWHGYPVVQGLVWMASMCSCHLSRTSSSPKHGTAWLGQNGLEMSNKHIEMDKQASMSNKTFNHAESYNTAGPQSLAHPIFSTPISNFAGEGSEETSRLEAM